jgi:putative DNA primase/helicase
MRTRNLKFALRAVGRNCRIIPLQWPDGEGLCSCGDSACSSVGKHPLITDWLRQATVDTDTIRKWWAQWPNANIGVVTGKASRIVVLDVDNRHHGESSLQALEKQNGPLPEGPQVITGGGRHRYFAHPGFLVKNKVNLLPGVDLRGDGGYVVAPGSLHKSGRTYLFKFGTKDLPLPTLPDWLLNRPVEPTPSSIESELVIPEGKRNATLASLAGTMRSRGMTQEAIEAALLKDNARRCSPPLTDIEVLRIAQSIGRYAPGDAEILSAHVESEERAENKLKFRTGKQIADETPAEVPWILFPWVASGAITEADGKVKLGKTTLVTGIVSAVLNGFRKGHSFSHRSAVRSDRSEA